MDRDGGSGVVALVLRHVWPRGGGGSVDRDGGSGVVAVEVRHVATAVVLVDQSTKMAETTAAVDRSTEWQQWRHCNGAGASGDGGGGGGGSGVIAD